MNAQLNRFALNMQTSICHLFSVFISVAALLKKDSYQEASFYFKDPKNISFLVGCVLLAFGALQVT